MHQSVMVALAAGATLVTANQRLARHLAAGYAAARQREGAVVWEAPDILPWPQWLERGWQDCLGQLESDTPQPLLTDAQELALWEAVIRSADTEPLLQVPAAARAAREAWQLLHAYRLRLPRADEARSEDVAAFTAWAERYRQRCHRRRNTIYRWSCCKSDSRRYQPPL